MRIGIIGGGFSGAVVAIRLSEEAPAGSEILVFDPSEELGRGVAYASRTDEYLLNVEARNLQPFPSDPARFYRWILAHRREACERFREPNGSIFAPRAWFGDFIGSELATGVRRAAAAGVRFRHERCAVTEIRPSGTTGLALKSNLGGVVLVDAAVLAVGNAGPPPLSTHAGSQGPAILQNAWDYLRLSLIDRDARVVIAGTGLTMADVISVLQVNRHRGSVIAVSRRGALPERADGQLPVFEGSPLPEGAGVRAWTRHVRSCARASEDLHGNWRPAIDWVRRITPTIWRSWPDTERTRFQRHMRARWELHRYQMPPATWRRVTNWLRTGQLRVLKGRLACVVGGGVQIRTGGAMSGLHCDTVINATGPDPTHSTGPSPLKRLLAQCGLDLEAVQRDGLDVDEFGHVIGLSASMNGRLWAVGPLARASFGELGTVTEIGALAAKLAQRLIEARAGVCRSTHTTESA